MRASSRPICDNAERANAIRPPADDRAAPSPAPIVRATVPSAETAPIVLPEPASFVYRIVSLSGDQSGSNAAKAIRLPSATRQRDSAVTHRLQSDACPCRRARGLPAEAWCSRSGTAQRTPRAARRPRSEASTPARPGSSRSRTAGGRGSLSWFLPAGTASTRARIRPATSQQTARRVDCSPAWRERANTCGGPGPARRRSHRRCSSRWRTRVPGHENCGRQAGGADRDHLHPGDHFHRAIVTRPFLGVRQDAIRHSLAVSTVRYVRAATTSAASSRSGQVTSFTRGRPRGSPRARSDVSIACQPV
jgi:hypothetical protein